MFSFDLNLKLVRVFRGPSIWANIPVIESLLSGEGLGQASAGDQVGLGTRLQQRVSAVKDPEGVVGRLELPAQTSDTCLFEAELIARLTLSLQTLAGARVAFGQGLRGAGESPYRILIAYDEVELAKACLEAARSLFLAVAQDQPYDLAAEVQRLRDVADQVCLGPSTQAIVQAARGRGIPVRRLNAGSLVQLGHGSRQHRICAAETDHTGAIAETVACDKELTKRLLRAVGVPVPEGRLVSDPEDAWLAARELQSPVVVKPINGNHGRAVFIGLTKPDEIRSAFEQALIEGDGVLVERSISGAEHRLLVVGDELVAATRGDPIFILGDGRRTVAELVDELNRDPRRGMDAALPLSPIEFDPPNLAVLAHQGFVIESVPPAGERVLVQRNGNLSRDVTDQVHPENAASAVLAARTVGLDVAGVDIVADDISRPLRQQGGAVVEVNAGPGLQMHLQPGVGTPRPAGEVIMASLFPPGATGRIPIVTVSAGGQGTVLARLISDLLTAAGVRAALACAEGTYANGQPLRACGATEPQTQADLLLHPMIEAAVFESPDAVVIQAGLGFDRCQVAVLVAGSAEAVSFSEPASVVAQRVLVGSVPAEGAVVLDATLPNAAELAAACAGEVILMADQASDLAVAEHLRRGGRAVFRRASVVMAARGAEEHPLTDLNTFSHHPPVTPALVVAGLAAIWALGIPPASD